MGNHTIRRETGPRRRNLGPTARLTKDSIDRLNAQRDEVIPLARGTRENVRSEAAAAIELVNASSHVVRLVPRATRPPSQEWPASEPAMAIEVAPIEAPPSEPPPSEPQRSASESQQMPGESRQTSTIQGMPPIDKAPAKPAPRHRDPSDSSALVYALIALVIASALFALWAMTR